MHRIGSEVGGRLTSVEKIRTGSTHADLSLCSVLASRFKEMRYLDEYGQCLRKSEIED
jgi:hypothetical protein